ncbi:hypothetical protein [Erythrobacter neustonensis]|uniref:Uncharacterized protein n=1 Tax=Erythrobacter neustonensis TaxID=1112 RepID=A0A192D1N2_9SPHN|nr:hypothetical protein [Erythrobacter neustonensis]ANK11876.1 hypothetical protein A9D12_01745 [Erythrobacter neustonensis]
MAMATATMAAPTPRGVPKEVYAAVKARFGTAHAALYEGADGAPVVPQPPTVMFRKVDINRDGTSDWLVDYERASTVIGGLCGTGGCLKQVFVSRGDGSYGLGFAAQAIKITVKRANSAMPAVLANMHGVHCGGTGSDACVIPMRWEPTAGRLVPVAYPDGAAVIRPFDALADAPVAAPPTILAKRDADRAICEKAGFTLPDADGESATYPFLDVNGDAILDWIVQPYCMQSETDDPVETPDGAQAAMPVLDNAVFVSRGSDFVNVWSGPDSLAFDLTGAQPAMVVSQEGSICDNDEAGACDATTTYIWDKVSSKIMILAQ